MKKNLTFFLFLLIPILVFPDYFYSVDPNLNILHYRVGIRVSDAHDRIGGETTITARFNLEPSHLLILDLDSPANSEKGMHVRKVESCGHSLKFHHRDDRLKIFLGRDIYPGCTFQVKVTYTGTPEKGLMILENKFGVRTFLGDNWPDKAHYWFPCIDHPSDKASCEFLVTAPSHYQVVANGIQKEITDMNENLRLSHWIETAPVATKVMMICISRFAVSHEPQVSGIPVQTWVFPEDREEGFDDFSITGNILRFFTEMFGPYSYSKIASIQAPTNYGGLENAGAISYFQDSVKEPGRPEALIAHEMAHQWFGDSVTEADWHHIWLSEGFATYFAAVYAEFNAGKEKFDQVMEKARQRVIRYYLKEKNSSVVDRSITELGKLLTANSYQKGAWVLHMLRRDLGDEDFFRGIRTFYMKYRNGNAVTADFRKTMEEISGKDLLEFFRQWVHGPGIPVLGFQWDYNKRKKKIRVRVRQLQTPGVLFHFPLEIGVKIRGVDKWDMKEVKVNGGHHTFWIDCPQPPSQVIPDPRMSLLFLQK